MSTTKMECRSVSGLTPSGRTLAEFLQAQVPASPCFCCGLPLLPSLDAEGRPLLTCEGCGAQIAGDTDLAFQAAA